ncbi:MAG: hypothetical protein Q9159_000412 [Coniocarpon cinnabarinum]
MSHAKALPGFNAISGQSILLYEHVSSNDARESHEIGGSSTGTDLIAKDHALQLDAQDSPSIIVLCTWMSASLRHIARYVNGYRRQHPTSHIIIIRCDPADVVRYLKHRQLQHLAPAVSAIQRLTEDRQKSEANMILHVFSNGGSHQACNLLQAYKQFATTPFPRHVTIFDSCPGHSSFKRTIAAMSASLPKTPGLHLLSLISVYVLVSLCWIAVVPLRLPDPVEVNYQTLKHPKAMRNELSRCYIYSVADPMVDWKDVEMHAQAAKKHFSVRMVKFETSEHCAHVLVDGGVRYWRIVSEAWNERGSVERESKIQS